MRSLRYTLVADGTSDNNALVPIIDEALAGIDRLADVGITSQFADPRQMGTRPATLRGRISQAIASYPCEILFIHRDAERDPWTQRLQEIRAAADPVQDLTYVPIIPVRMTEAWLLIEEQAIRRAADNPNGRYVIHLPRLHDLEDVVDPKELLNQLLLAASELSGRRLAQFRRKLSWRRSRVASLITDFSPLQHVPAFAEFIAETRRVVHLWAAARRD